MRLGRGNRYKTRLSLVERRRNRFDRTGKWGPPEALRGIRSGTMMEFRGWCSMKERRWVPVRIVEVNSRTVKFRFYGGTSLITIGWRQTLTDLRHRFVLDPPVNIQAFDTPLFEGQPA